MQKSENKSGNKKKPTEIGKAFTKRQSTDFYKYYRHGRQKKVLISTWDQLRDFYDENFPQQEASKWLFRGDVYVPEKKRLIEEAFRTSLDKAFEEFETPADTPDQRETFRNQIEKRILRAFRRRAHLLTGGKDSTQTHLETVALLRHHGGPSRILDWMYSFYPAVYLAMNKKYDKNRKFTTYTVWALNKKWLNCIGVQIEDQFLKDTRYIKRHFGKKVIEQQKDRRQRHRDLKYLQKYNNNLFQSYVITYLMNENFRSLIYAATPYHFNERLVAQRATLLFSGTVDKTWGQNLKDTINKSIENRLLKRKGGETEGPILWEIPFRLSKDERKQFLRGLDEMGINQASLFPDLDGFAESLTRRIAYPESLGVNVQ